MINVVIADKNNNSKELIHNYLKEANIVCDVFCYGNLNSIDCNLKNIDLIIFDVDSNSVLENTVIVNELKAKYKNLNFIATSYEISSELVSKVLKQNVADFLIKPLISNILIASIKKITSSQENKLAKKAKTITISVVM